MKEATFDFNGVNSDRYGVWVQYRPVRSAAQRNYLSGNASNRSGTDFRDGKTYLNSELTLQCIFKHDESKAVLEDIYQWLDTPGYVPLQLWYDEKYKYKAKVTSVIKSSTVDVDHEYYSFDLEFSLYPFKYDYLNKAADGEVTASKPIVLDNSKSNITAFPYLEYTNGAVAGDFVINWGNKKYTFTKVQANQVISIDCSIPRTNAPYNMVGLDFPVLDGGKTTRVSIVGSGKLKITGKLVRRVM